MIKNVFLEIIKKKITCKTCPFDGWKQSDYKMSETGKTGGG